MNSREVRFGAVNRLLEGLGFVPHRVPGSHINWEHRPTGTTILLPDKEPDEVAWWNSVVAVGAQLDLHGVMGREEFDRWLEQASKPAGRNGPPAAPKRERHKAKPQSSS